MGKIDHAVLFCKYKFKKKITFLKIMSHSLPRIVRTDTVAEGRFLALKNILFQDERGRERHWEGVDRVNSAGAVLIVAVLKPSERLILVRQFRPPAGRYLIEFPAGLIDPGETPARTAERELYEETGYRGKLLAVLPPGYNSPGMSGETIVTAVIEVADADYPEPPVPHQEDSEQIEVILPPKAGLAAFLEQAVKDGCGIDAKLTAYALNC